MIMRYEDILGYSVATVSPEACVDALMKGIDAANRLLEIYETVIMDRRRNRDRNLFFGSFS